MLNHFRPQETSWKFDEQDQGFTITALHSIGQGAQIYDSYGKKCNHRFLLNYGFAVVNNVEDGRNPNEVWMPLNFLQNEPPELTAQKRRYLHDSGVYSMDSSRLGHQESPPPIRWMLRASSDSSHSCSVGCHSRICIMLPTSTLTVLFATAVAADYSRWGQYLAFPPLKPHSQRSDRYLEIRYGPTSKRQTFTITPDLSLDGLQLPEGLQSFKLNRVQLKSIPSSFRWPSTLQANDLSSNNLTDIPKDVPWPAKLTSLYVLFVLSGNQIQECGPNLPSSLTELDLGSNKLTCIRACNWPASLEKLSLSSNPLKVLSKSQKWPKQLKQLSMDNTQLQHVPSTFPDSIDQLTLNYNQIQYFPKKLLRRCLRCSSILFYHTLPSALDKFPALTSIELNNNIKALPEGLKLAKDFRMLYLSNNKLSTLPSTNDWIQQIGFTLQLDGNALTSLPANAVFPDGTNVAHNQIKVLQDITLPKKINLSQNPIETVSRPSLV
ncbi:Aste57867_1828 [Aphanomyces stellatus]|uniref:Aste57867_1828 protein n=1 Tax=Aphanomyces stellatus TaxID=120398 RepID=A0A485K682_9STRA|nr:hypothetical protein As57867_001826 [Aphanomyces stellatus]VFT79036.1 Aste57867_1828 [Aphanomyces stellatus]